MANFNLNKIILGGRICNDVELRTTTSGLQVVRLTIAVNRRTGEGNEPMSDFFPVTAWRERAEFVAKYFRKGSPICVVGSMHLDVWTDKTGGKRYDYSVTADEVNFVESRRDAEATSGPPELFAPPGPEASKPEAQYEVSGNVGGMDTIPDDSGLPF